MKKSVTKAALGVAMASALAFGGAVSAFAVEQVGAGDADQSRHTDVYYNGSGVDPEGPGGTMYVVTIPSRVNLVYDVDVPAEVSAEQVKLGSGETLKVSILSADFKVTNTKPGMESDTLPYTVVKASGGQLTDGQDNVVLSVAADAGSGSETLNFKLTQDSDYTDEYHGNLTFGVNVE